MFEPKEKGKENEKDKDKEKEIQRYRDSEIQRYRDTEIRRTEYGDDSVKGTRNTVHGIRERNSVKRLKEFPCQ